MPLVTSRPEKINCIRCTKEFETKVYTHPDGHEQYGSKICPDCRQKDRDEAVIRNAQEQLQRTREHMEALWDEEVNVPGVFVEKSFESFDRKLQPKAYDVVKGYDGKSIVLFSPNVFGVGKTHLVCALAAHLVDSSPKADFRRGCYQVTSHHCPVRFETEAKLLTRIRETFSHSEDETEEDIYRFLDKFPLLIIDDVGKVRPRDLNFLQGVYFRIIDSRYCNEQPIILTTNLDLTELEEFIGGASADRLREMVGKNFVKMIGTSYRKK